MAHKQTVISRRRVLATVGSLAASVLLPEPIKRVFARTYADAASLEESISGEELGFIQPRPAHVELLARITAPGTPVRETTGLNQPVARWLHQNEVLPVFEKVYDTGNNPNNDLWYRVEDGFVYTPTVQPVNPYRTPSIATSIDNGFGLWGEIIVPYTTAHTRAGGLVATLEDDTPSILYYTSVHRVIDVEADKNGNPWYKLYDDRPKSPPVYVPARFVRIIPEDELAPISPGANKRIVINLDEQRLYCYEGDKLVHESLTSTGGEGFATPRGEWHVVLKQPSRHMYSDPENEVFSDPNYFDLPGVPFVVFFTTLGHACHGTYWHGDFGRPRSHGCPNLPPDAAQFVYRWTEPIAPYYSDFVPGDRETGTPVRVV